jgi:hypothetical protein
MPNSNIKLLERIKNGDFNTSNFTEEQLTLVTALIKLAYNEGCEKGLINSEANDKLNRINDIINDNDFEPE